MLRRWDDSQKYLSDNPHLVCEETANCLVVICIDFEIDEVSVWLSQSRALMVGGSVATGCVHVQKQALMEQVAHQAIVMKFILDLAQTLKVDPRGCFRQFFTKIKVGSSPLLLLLIRMRRSEV